MSRSELSPEGANARWIDPELVEQNDQGVRLRGGRCRACGALSFPRVQACTQCLSLDVESVALSNEGVLYSFSRVHLAPKGWDLPYVLGYVDLPEGVRVLAHIDERRTQPSVGARVRLDAGRVGVGEDGAILRSYVFAPIEGERS